MKLKDLKVGQKFRFPRSNTVWERKRDRKIYLASTGKVLVAVGKPTSRLETWLEENLEVELISS